MYQSKTSRGLLKYFNKRGDYNPVLSNGTMAYDQIKKIVMERNRTGTYQYSVIEFLQGTNQFVEYIYSCKYTLSKGIQIQENVIQTEDNHIFSKNCYYISYGMCLGFHSFFEKKTSSYYYGTIEHSDTFGTDKWLPTEKIYRTELFDFNDIVKIDDSLKYCGYQRNGYIYFIDYVKLYRKYPIAEMLMKLEMYRLITEKCLKEITENKYLRNYIQKNREEILKHNMAFQTVFNSYKKNAKSIGDYYNSLMYRMQTGKEVAFDNKEMYRFILKYTTQEKLNDYLTENHISKSSYQDYVKTARYLKLNFEDTKVLYPRNFIEVHDEYINLYQKDEKERQDKLFENINQKFKEVAEKYAFIEQEIGDYVIKLAKSKTDLIDEGSQLEHCVGKMDYDERISNEESLVLFVRKKETPFLSFATVELGISETVEVRQCYGKKNSLVPEIKELLKSYVKEIKPLIEKVEQEEHVYIKAVDKDLKSFNGFKFEIGKEYSTKYQDEEVNKFGVHNLATDKIFHCCRDMENAKKFTLGLFKSERRFLEVKLLGPIVSRNGDCGSNRIRILREVAL